MPERTYLESCAYDDTVGKARKNHLYVDGFETYLDLFRGLFFVLPTLHDDTQLSFKTAPFWAR